MIDFQNGTFIKLSPLDPHKIADELDALLVPGEQVHCR